jgi:subtilisin-like proprotein convertase family protein
MKHLQSFLLALMLGSVAARGALYPSDTLNTVIPDANPTGVSSTLNISGIVLPTVGDVNVIINVTGGYNGDLYAYLSHNGTLVPLLNRVGTSPSDPFGFSTAGFNNITLDSQAVGGSIHNVASPLSTSSYTPDGGSLNAFNGSDPNGTWTLFFADMASGGGTGPSTLVSWSLGITAVPEPVNVALGTFGGTFLIVFLVRTYRARQRSHSLASAPME